MVIIVKITEDRSTINNTSTDPTEDNPTLIGQSDKKDYTVKLTADPEDTSENIIGLRLYLGCYKNSNIDSPTNNCKLSVIDHNNQIYSAINPINPEAENEAKVLRYVITNEDITELTRVGSSGIEIKVQLETSQDNAESRTPMEDEYILKAHVEYTRCSSLTSNYPINVKVLELDVPPPGP